MRGRPLKKFTTGFPQGLRTEYARLITEDSGLTTRPDAS